jgi:hypothetical protein
MKTPSEVREDLELIEIKAGMWFSKGKLKEILPDVETALFFGAVYELDYVQLSTLLSEVLKSDLARELFNGAHSTDLQGYLVDELSIPSQVRKGPIKFDDAVVPKGEILPHVWASLQVEVAQSLKDVASRLKRVVGDMPGKQGQMFVRSLFQFNRRRPTLGVTRAQIEHPLLKQNLVILDVSGSVTRHTVTTIIEDVIALAYMANAHLAIVSDQAFHWEPGSYDVPNVLSMSTFGGTHYEQLAPLLQKDWGVVVTIADYDSSKDAARYLRDKCRGRIDQVVDISLVNRPTYLAECVGQLADEVKPVLIGPHIRVLNH